MTNATDKERIATLERLVISMAEITEEAKGRIKELEVKLACHADRLQTIETDDRNRTKNKETWKWIIMAIIGAATILGIKHA